MMISNNVYNRMTSFYYQLTAPEELINLIDETLLQAIWDSEEKITNDQLVSLAIDIIKTYKGLND